MCRERKCKLQVSGPLYFLLGMQLWCYGKYLLVLKDFFVCFKTTATKPMNSAECEKTELNISGV